MRTDARSYTEKWGGSLLATPLLLLPTNGATIHSKSYALQHQNRACRHASAMMQWHGTWSSATWSMIGTCSLLYSVHSSGWILTDNELQGCPTSQHDTQNPYHLAKKKQQTLPHPRSSTRVKEKVCKCVHTWVQQYWYQPMFAHTLEKSLQNRKR